MALPLNKVAEIDDVIHHIWIPLDDVGERLRPASPEASCRAAYDSKALLEKLAAQGTEDKIAYKAQRSKPLKNWQKWFNTAASSVRPGVERSNATMKNGYGMVRVRYLGLARNNCHLRLVACAMNMKRGLVLLGAA